MLKTSKFRLMKTQKQMIHKILICFFLSGSKVGYHFAAIQYPWNISLQKKDKIWCCHAVMVKWRRRIKLLFKEFRIINFCGKQTRKWFMSAPYFITFLTNNVLMTILSDNLKYINNCYAKLNQNFSLYIHSIFST